MINKEYMRRKKAGFTLVELLVGLAIFVTVVISMYGVLSISNRAVTKAGEKHQAAFLLEEGMEAIRRFRDAGWDTNIATKTAGGTVYCLSFAGSAFSLTPAAGSCPLVDNFFSRTVQFYNACRATSSGSLSDIVGYKSGASCASGTEDQRTKYVLITVGWKGYQETMAFYLTDLFRN